MADKKDQMCIVIPMKKEKICVP